MKKMRKLTTEREIDVHLAADPRPRRLAILRVQGRWRLDALGRWWTPGELSALAVGVVAAVVALWMWLG